jgi:ArsR family transcriptional regulator
MNMYSDPDDDSILAAFFQGFGQTSRLRILLAIGAEEACVCHLEAWLGYRQAYLSQQLKVLRDAHLVKTSKIGKHVYYSLADHRLLDLIHAGAAMAGVRLMVVAKPEGPLPGCICPHCNQSQWIPELVTPEEVEGAE